MFTTTASAITTTTTTTTNNRHRRPGRASALVAVAAVALLGACGNSREAAGPDTTGATPSTVIAPLGGDDQPTVLPPPAPAPDPDGGTDADPGPGAPEGGGDAPDSGGEDGGGSGGELEPAGGEEPGPDPLPGPCADVLATGATLLVSPAPAVLPSGTLDSSLTVTNCSDTVVDWTAATIPNVALATSNGQLDARATADLGFTIDAAAYQPGAIEFKIKVSEPGHNHYVDVQAFRESLGMDLDTGLGLATGPNPGCAEQCVVSASLQTNATSPDVGIDVVTNVPAMLNVYVSESAPIEQNGHPAFADGSLKAFSNGFVESMSATIGSLAPATDYHLILEAVDEQGNAWYATTTFHTITPLDLPVDVETPDGPAGCYAQCITAATVEPQGPATALHVETHTSALLAVWVSTEAFTLDDDGVPLVDGIAPLVTTDGLDVTEWDTVLSGLDFATDYHIVVEASDLSGGRSYRIGTFRTADGAQVEVRFWTVTVVDDADDGDNPGEISMAWGYNGMTLGARGEQQIESGTTVLLDGDTSFTFTDTGEFMPILNVTVHEYDDPGITESCPWAYGTWNNWGSAADCGLKVNVAGSGIATAAIFDSLPRCSDFGLVEVADQPCMVLEAAEVGNGDHPLFWAVVSFAYVGA